MTSWATRELVVLRAIVEAEEADGDPDAAAWSVGDLSEAERLRCIQRLHDGGFIEARFNRGDNRLLGAHVVRALPAALRAVGVWPRAATPLEEKRRRRLAFMERLYERTDGDRMQRVDFRDIATQLGWTEEEATAVVYYLKDEGLLELPTMGGAVSLSHAGVVEMEAAMEDPEQPTVHFPPINVVNIFGDVRSSQIQAGTANSGQEQSGA